MSLKKKAEKEKKVTRNCWIKTRVTEQERILFKEKAAASGSSLSSFQRQSLLDSVIIKPQNILDVETVLKISDIGNSLKYIPSISNNLNQLVKYTHIHDETDTDKMQELLTLLISVEWLNIKDDLEKIVKELI